MTLHIQKYMTFEGEIIELDPTRVFEQCIFADCEFTGISAKFNYCDFLGCKTYSPNIFDRCDMANCNFDN